MLLYIDVASVWQTHRGQASGGPRGGVVAICLEVEAQVSLASVLPRILPPQPVANTCLVGPASWRAALTASCPCRHPGPVLPRPSLTSQPRTHRSSASTVATSLRSWNAWTLTGGGAASVGVLASSLRATSSQCTCDRSGVLGAEPADQLSTQL